MTKIMLVEDDKSLREIYGVRLLAEGYDIVSAGDGEEALAMAIKERPQLIVSDVMMPKISGFDMLDILRSTTETKNIKVIMMTALSSEEQRQRGESLGADRYLVKSQVGIEDVVRVVHEVLEDQAPASAAPAAGAPAAAPPVPAPTPVAAPSAPAPSSPAPAAPAPAPSVSSAPQPASLKTRVIQPLGDPTTPAVDINALLDKELAKEAGITDDARPEVQTTAQEKDLVSSQISSFEPPVTVTVSEDGSVTDTSEASGSQPSSMPTPSSPASSSATAPSDAPADIPPPPPAPPVPGMPQSSTPAAGTPPVADTAAPASSEPTQKPSTPVV